MTTRNNPDRTAGHYTDVTIHEASASDNLTRALIAGLATLLIAAGFLVYSTVELFAGETYYCPANMQDTCGLDWDNDDGSHTSVTLPGPDDSTFTTDLQDGSTTITLPGPDGSSFSFELD